MPSHKIFFHPAIIARRALKKDKDKKKIKSRNFPYGATPNYPTMGSKGQYHTAPRSRKGPNPVVLVASSVKGREQSQVDYFFRKIQHDILINMEAIPSSEMGLNITEAEPKTPRNKLSPEERIARQQSEVEEKKLADAICEKYKKGDVFGFSLEKSGNSFSVILEGVKVGIFAIRDTGDTKQMAFITLNENLRHKGFGKQLYIKLNEHFKSIDGSVLATDTMRTSDDADSLWISLEKDGLVEETPDYTADGHKVYRFKR